MEEHNRHIPAIFHEAYGVYYAVVEELIRRAGDAPLTYGDLAAVVETKGFRETGAQLLPQLAGQWPLLEECGGAFGTSLKCPGRPVTLLEKRWFAVLLHDPRICLFLDDGGIADLRNMLGDVEPLYRQGDCYVFDRDGSPDPFTDEVYRRNFRVILKALREKRCLRVYFTSGKGHRVAKCVQPLRLQYSCKDDKFRLLALCNRKDGTTREETINVGRMHQVRILAETSDPMGTPSVPLKGPVVLELTEERGALQRALIHFASFACEAYVRDDGQLILEIAYDARDETELLIRVLAFGPLVRVREPACFVAQIRERVNHQMRLFKQNGA